MAFSGNIGPLSKREMLWDGSDLHPNYPFRVILSPSGKFRIRHCKVPGKKMINWIYHNFATVKKCLCTLPGLLLLPRPFRALGQNICRCLNSTNLRARPLGLATRSVIYNGPTARLRMHRRPLAQCICLIASATELNKLHFRSVME